MANYIFPKVPATLLAGDTISFSYTGNVQILDLKKVFINKAKIEVWGAAGSHDTHAWGGHAWGNLDFEKLPKTVTKLYCVVGECGNRCNRYWGTFGGGGGADSSDSGGGASDVRTYYNPKATDFVESRRDNSVDKGTCTYKSLHSRLIVGSGGGALDDNGRRQGPGYPGVAFSGIERGGHFESAGDGHQTGSYGSGDDPSGHGRFGVGGTAHSGSGGGGGGWYGGSASDSGGGGSCYISGDPHCPTLTSCGVKLTNTGAQGGVRSGHGLIKITIIEPGFQLSNKKLCYKKAEDVTVEMPLFVYNKKMTDDILHSSSDSIHMGSLSTVIGDSTASDVCYEKNNVKKAFVNINK